MRAIYLCSLACLVVGLSVAPLPAAPVPDGGPPLALTADGALAGVAYGPDGKTPCPGATVQVFDGDKLVATVTTNAFGQFTVPGLKPGPHKIVISGHGLGFSGTVNLAAPAADVVPALATFILVPPPLDLLLVDGQAAGIVYGVDGKTPIAGAKVRLFDKGRLIGTALTDENGRFRIGGLKPGTYRIEATMLGFGYIGYVNLWSDDQAPPEAVAEGSIRMLSPSALFVMSPLFLRWPVLASPSGGGATRAGFDRFGGRGSLGFWSSGGSGNNGGGPGGSPSLESDPPAASSSGPPATQDEPKASQHRP